MSLRFQVLYGLVVLALEREYIMHVGVTEHPTAEWSAQLLREYAHHYDGRPHRGLRLQPPAGEKWLAPA